MSKIMLYTPYSEQEIRDTTNLPRDPCLAYVARSKEIAALNYFLHKQFAGFTAERAATWERYCQPFWIERVS